MKSKEVKYMVAGSFYKREGIMYTNRLSMVGVMATDKDHAIKLFKQSDFYIETIDDKFRVGMITACDVDSKFEYLKIED